MSFLRNRDRGLKSAVETMMPEAASVKAHKERAGIVIGPGIIRTAVVVGRWRIRRASEVWPPSELPRAVILRIDGAESHAASLGRNRQWGLELERQRSFRREHRGPTAREQYAEEADGCAGARPDRRTFAPAGRGANGRPNSGGRAKGRGVTPARRAGGIFDP